MGNYEYRFRKPIVMYKKGEPTMIKRKDGTYIDNMEEWHEAVEKIKQNKKSKCEEKWEGLFF